MRAFTAGQWDEWFFRFVIWDHFFHKLIHLNYWSEILRPPLSALGGDLNRSTQHTRRTSLLASDIARSCEAVR
jgi:hypothetical protein